VIILLIIPDENLALQRRCGTYVENVHGLAFFYKSNKTKQVLTPGRRVRDKFRRTDDCINCMLNDGSK